MFNLEDQWDLPYFFYLDGFNHETDICCSKLATKLRIPNTENPRFVTVFELLGAMASWQDTTGNGPGYSQLMLIEPQISWEHLNSSLPHFC